MEKTFVPIKDMSHFSFYLSMMYRYFDLGHVSMLDT